MLDFEYRKDLDAGRVCFEISLKPFKQTDNKYITGVCEELFDQWAGLLKYASSCAVMLWTADGSEILDFSGVIDDEFEWGRYIGIGNPTVKLPDGDPRNDNLHIKPVIYTDNPPVMRYLDLKRIISILKQTGKKRFGFDIEVGETFDPGPEFAYSDFKYHRHSEISLGNIMGKKNWIHCAVRLNGDNHKYAAYPEGIPDGLHFGTFLARQFMELKKAVGFDYIWLSNGFGYSLDSWNWTGEVFDGKSFDYTNAEKVRSAIYEFWTEFTSVCDCRIETRGSNLSSGMDMSAHGSPIKDIYSFNITAPPNSPWAALDSRFGLELTGYMSHIAELPSNGYLFRYYTHDPWWRNSPWFDRYNRQPHDIYLPLAVARLDKNGKVTPPSRINFLSVDDSYGNMPRRCPYEVTPHLLNAYNDYPDEAGLLTWVYPFGYYDALALKEGKPDKVFMDDWFIESAIDEGLPLNTVISDINIKDSDYKSYANTILLMPVPKAGADLENILLSLLENGNKVLLFGGMELASEKVKELVGVTETEALDGEFEISTEIYKDISIDNNISGTLNHISLLSGGGISTVSTGSVETLASVKSLKSGEIRAYATYNRSAVNGSLIWIHGSFPHCKSSGHLPGLVDRSTYFKPAALLRCALEKFGITIRFTLSGADAKLPLILVARRNNGYFMSAYAKDTSVKATLNFPEGAPVINGFRTVIDENGAEYYIPKWLHEECRIFVRQKERGEITSEVRTAENIHFDRKVALRGLKDAEVTFLPPKDSHTRFILNDDSSHSPSNVEMTYSDGGKKITAKNITGVLCVAWSN